MPFCLQLVHQVFLLKDMEDMEPEKNGSSFNSNSKTKMNNYKKTPIQSIINKTEYVTKEQQWEIFKVINENMIPINDAKSLLKEKYSIDQTKQLTIEQADEFIDILKCYSAI